MLEETREEFTLRWAQNRGYAHN